jgi:hypothetical protein
MRQFELTDADDAKLQAWIEKHDKICLIRGTYGSRAGTKTFTFTPSLDGTEVGCACSCGSKLTLNGCKLSHPIASAEPKDHPFDRILI